ASPVTAGMPMPFRSRTRPSCNERAAVAACRENRIVGQRVRLLECRPGAGLYIHCHKTAHLILAIRRRRFQATFYPRPCRLPLARATTSPPMHRISDRTMSHSPEAIVEGKKRPFTGAEFVESLRDGREVYIYGERVADVTKHPAFRNSVASVALLYDALHDPKTKDVLTAPTDTGSGGYTHKFFKVARSAQDVIAQRDAIAAWARITYGWMGRSPDYKAAFLNTLGANAEFYGKFADNARAWHKRAQESVLYLNHALVNPPIDRNKPVEQVKDVYITIQKETDAGIYVSGAKVVATNSALTHYNFLGQNMGQEITDPSMAVMFIAPMNTPGIKLICRPSYELAAAATGSPWDYPLTSRFDENDAIFVFDNAFIPWENVFIHRDVERLKSFYPRSGFFNGFTLQGCTRLAVKLDFIVGLLHKAARATGVEGFRGVQAQIGEVIRWRNLFWSLSDAMVFNPEPWINGAVLPPMGGRRAPIVCS